MATSSTTAVRANCPMVVWYSVANMASPSSTPIASAARARHPYNSRIFASTTSWCGLRRLDPSTKLYVCRMSCASGMTRTISASRIRLLISAMACVSATNINLKDSTTSGLMPCSRTRHTSRTSLPAITHSVSEF